MVYPLLWVMQDLYHQLKYRNSPTFSNPQTAKSTTRRLESSMALLPVKPKVTQAPLNPKP